MFFVMIAFRVSTGVCRDISKFAVVHSRDTALEELICVGNGGLTSSHFVQCGVIFVCGDGLVPPLPFRSPAGGGFHATDR